MNTSVLMSIRPEWCDKIISGAKTVEVRKKAPKIPAPYKVYMYCTQGTRTLYRSNYDGAVRLCDKRRDAALSHHTVFNGTVLGEFICDSSFTIFRDSDIRYGIDYPNDYAKHLMRETGLTLWEMLDYLGPGEDDLTGLHISDLTVYDKPRPLSDFQTRHDKGRWIEWKHLTRPPQNFCYVKEV